MQWKYDIVVIGAGAAGIAAVKSACVSGCRSILFLDTRKQVGGVLLQCTHHGFGPGLTGPEYIEKLMVGFPEEAEVWLDTTVLSINTEKELLVSGAAVGVRTVSFQQLILAAGCLEIPLGFLSVAGTRPKGIYTAGQVQEMISFISDKVSGEWCEISERYQERSEVPKVPEGPVVILGSGDLGLILAGQLAERGITVAALVEQKSVCGGMTVNQKCLDTYRIPLICSSTVNRIYGTDHITGVEITNQLTGESYRIPCRSLLTAVGLRPDRSLLEKMMTGMRKNYTGQTVTGMEMAEEERYPDWVHVCGNCKSVHPMIEAVIKEGKQAGVSAWENIKKADEENKYTEVIKTDS